MFSLTLVQVAGTSVIAFGRSYPIGGALYPLGFMVASPRDNRFACYQLGTSLIPFEFHANFAKWFTYSALGLGYPTGVGLAPFGVLW